MHLQSGTDSPSLHTKVICNGKCLLAPLLSGVLLVMLVLWLLRPVDTMQAQPSVAPALDMPPLADVAAAPAHQITTPPQIGTEVASQSRRATLDAKGFAQAGGTATPGLQTYPNWNSRDRDDTTSVVWGDMDGDGDLDLAVGNLLSASKVYRNDGGILQQEAIWSSVDTDHTLSLAWGDIDGDGDLDLAVGNGGANKVYRNDGGILQQEAIWSSVDTDRTLSVAWGDIDGDGDLDLAVGNGGANKVYRNEEGVLPWVALPFSADEDVTNSVAWGDIDGDGDLDLAVGNSRRANQIYRNEGGVLLKASAPFSADEDDTNSVAWGDIDSDGDLDLAVGNSGSANKVYLNDGGLLKPVAAWFSADEDDTSGIAWGDMDGDGDLDLAVSNSRRANKVYRNDGGGLQRMAAWLSVDEDVTNSVAWGDIDGDGDLDLAVGNGELVYSISGRANKVYLNDGVVLQQEATWTSADEDVFSSIAWGDMDGDGDLDLAVGNAKRPNKVYLNEGGVLQQEAAWTSAEADITNSVAWGDMDGDGDLDLAVGNARRPNKVYLNDGVVLQQEAAWTSAEADITNSVAWGDMDGDGDLDLAVGNGDLVFGLSGRANQVYLNEGGILRREAAWTSVESDHTSSVAWGDMDGDGDLDLAVGNWGGSSGRTNQVYLNEEGVLQRKAAWFSADEDDTSSVAWGDMDGDGDLDLAVGNGDFIFSFSGRANKVYRNERGILQREAAWFSTEADVTFSVAWEDMDGDGDLDLAVGNWDSPNKVYRNTIQATVGLPNHSPQIVVGQPIGVLGPNRSVLPEILTSRTITIPYSLYDPEGDPVGHIKAFYSLDGGGQWVRAMSAQPMTATQNLQTGRSSTWADLTPQLIPNNTSTPFTTTLQITDSAEIAETEVWFTVTHPVNAELAITLHSPAGTRIPLFSTGQARGQNFSATRFSDNVTTTLVVSGTAPYRGVFRPIAPLATLKGEKISGTWSLTITNTGSELGILAAWGLRMKTPPVAHPFSWDTLQSGLFGQSDNVAIRMVASTQALSTTVSISGTYRYTNSVAGPFQRAYVSATTLPFRVRGRQVQVYSDTITTTNIVSNALVYRLPKEQSRNAQPISDRTHTPYHTNNQGYLQGRGELITDDQLVALWPTDRVVAHTPSRRFSSRNASAIMIPPSTTAESPIVSKIVVPDARRIGDVEVLVNISHTQAAELTLKLVSPSGRKVRLITTTYGIGDTTFDVTLNDGTASVFNTSTITNVMRPVEALAHFQGELANGEWTLHVENRGTTTATLTGWDLNLQLSQLYYTSHVQPERQKLTVSGTREVMPASVVTSTLAISDAGQLGALAVRVSLSNTRAADLALHLIAPGGQKVSLITTTAGITVGNRISVTLNDAARTPFGSGAITGTVKPAQALSSFVGEMTGGIWTLQIENWGTTAATLTGWGIDYTLDTFKVKKPGIQRLVVSDQRPLLLFDLVVSLEWDARNDEVYLSRLHNDLLRTSELLYDWTDGQAALGNITVYHDRQHWDEADIRIQVSNRLRPNADLGGIVSEPYTETVVIDEKSDTLTYGPGQVRMPVAWNRLGDAGSGDIGEDWPRTLAHELGHYLFFLHDNYLGLDENERLIPVTDCPGAMSNQYIGSREYDEFQPQVDWPPKPCEQTLSNRLAGRADWATITRHYPWVISPTVAISNSAYPTGPNVLPLAVTQVITVDHEPLTPTNALEVSLFTLVRKDGSPYYPSNQARAFLFDGSDRETVPRLIDLGRPTGNLLNAWGAKPGQRLCVLDLDRQHTGCETLTTNDTLLTLHPSTDGAEWQPDLVVTPDISGTIKVSVTVGIESPMPALKARLYPVDELSPPGNTITLTLVPTDTTSVTGLYSGTFTVSPTREAYIHLWVDDDDSADFAREAVIDYAIGGNPGPRWGRWWRRWWAPILSSDGHTTLMSKVFDHANEGEFFAIQTTSRVPNPPPWVTVVGQAYRIIRPEKAAYIDLQDASLSMTYQAGDVPPGEEQWLTIYHYGETNCTENSQNCWVPLPTEQQLETNTAVAPVTQPGLYALMSSLEIPLDGPDWNLVSYPVSVPLTRTIADALRSIADSYTVVYGYDKEQPDDPWQAFSPHVAEWVNDLDVVEFGQGYLLYVTEPTTLLIKGISPGLVGDRTALPSSVRAEFEAHLRVPPALYFGKINDLTLPEDDAPVIAYVNGQRCGQGHTQVYEGEVVYRVKVQAAESGSNQCGASGQLVTFRVGTHTMATQAEWDNRSIQEIDLER